MKDCDCVAFLQWSLPRLQFRWPGFRRVRRQVCRRVARRVADLGLSGVAAYRRHIETSPEEWRHLDALCRVTISRFYRDKGVFDRLETDILPALASRARERGDGGLRCWSAGCASGEEAYTLNILWRLGPGHDLPGLPLAVLATDSDPHMVERARRGRFGKGSLKDTPAAWINRAFQADGRLFQVRAEFHQGIEFGVHDIRDELPAGPFDLVLCRNLAFTYFEEALQHRVLQSIAKRLVAGGVLVVGAHEHPPPVPSFVPSAAGRAFLERSGPGPGERP